MWNCFPSQRSELTVSDGEVVDSTWNKYFHHEVVPGDHMRSRWKVHDQPYVEVLCVSTCCADGQVPVIALSKPPVVRYMNVGLGVPQRHHRHSKILQADVAHLAERRVGNAKVPGSTPGVGSKSMTAPRP